MDVTRSYSRCFHGHNLHSRVPVFFFCPIKPFYISFKLKRIIYILLLCDKKFRSPCLFKRKKNFILLRALLEENFFRCVRARANLRALMTQKSCAVGIRNGILRNHLKTCFNIFFDVNNCCKRVVGLIYTKLIHVVGLWLACCMGQSSTV